MEDTELFSTVQSVHSHRGRNMIKKNSQRNSRPGNPGYLKGQFKSLGGGWALPFLSASLSSAGSSLARTLRRAASAGSHCRTPAHTMVGADRAVKAAGSGGAGSQPRVPGGVHAA